MEFKNLMGDFAVKIGIGDKPAFDADGVWRIGSDAATFAFSEIRETDELLIHCELCELPVYGADKFKTALLRADYMNRGTGGAVLSLSDNDRVCLHLRTRLGALTVESLADVFERFVRVALEWQALARDFSARHSEV